MTIVPNQPRVVREAAPAAVVRVPLERRVEAAARLLGDPAGARSVGAKRMVAAAAAQGMDLSLMWGTVDRDVAGHVAAIRQAALLVPGTGKTAMVMVSHPLGCGVEAERAELGERVACLEAAVACARLTPPRGPVHLVQALPDPQEYWALQAFAEAGFVHVGELSYLSRKAGLDGLTPSRDPWPPGIAVRNVRAVEPGQPDHDAVLTALERTYEQTMDCPELCGLRDTVDVLESHRVSGQFDPQLWWLVEWQGEPHGCLMLNPCPDLGTLELVYLGLSPEIRGMRLGTRLLSMGLMAAHRLTSDLGIEQVTCAVDLRNEPAMRLYQRLGFERCGRRAALVRSLRGGGAAAV